MDSGKLNDWMQVVGIFALVASLVFVGMQMEQDREIALAATYQDRTIAVADVFTALASNKEVMSHNLKAHFGTNPHGPSPMDSIHLAEGVEPVLALETYAAFNNAAAFWLHWQNSHYQYMNGFLPQSHWARIRDIIKVNLSLNNSMPRWVFDTSPGLFSLEFQQVINELIAEIDAENAD